MGFVNSNEVDVHVAQLCLEEGRPKPLRGDIKKFVVAEDTVLKGYQDFLV